MTSLRDVVGVLDSLYDPRWADDWDAVGTVVGDPDAPVRRILLAVDPVAEVVAEAIDLQVDLLVTHHPLYLKGVTSVAASTAKGRVVHELIRHGIALHTCHTNADSPPLGVSESMALALGLEDVRPLQDDEHPLDAWAVHVPSEDAEAVTAALHAAGAGRVGDYEQTSFTIHGVGSFRPTEGARPAIGQVGRIETVDEARVEVVAQRSLREHVRAALFEAHPYEEVSHHVIEIAAGASGRGSGRIGTLAAPMTLASFARHVADRLPNHHSLTRVAGDPETEISTVALCGGSGDFLLDAADAAGADVYVTSDLRHHPVSEHREKPGACAVVDVPHWAAEWTWLPVAARAVSERLDATVETHVSTIVTDPWTMVVTPS